MENNKKLLMLLLLFVILTGCSNSGSGESDSPEKESAELLIPISEAKEEIAGIQTGSIKKLLLSEIVECNGTVESNPNNQAIVSPMMEGYLTKIHVQIGQRVKKGQRLATLSHPGYVTLQQEFLETKSQYNFYKEDFKRQGELSLEQAVSIKKMQEAQNAFRKVEARLFAMRHQLAFLGINADSLNVENMQSDIWLISPLTGFVSEIEGSIGMLCKAENAIFRIMGSGRSMLHLQVYEKDALLISPGQDIEFSPITDPEKKYHARVISSTSNIDENNLINLHADVKDSDNLLPGMYVKARIMVSTDSVYAMKRDAVITSENQSYIFEKLDSSQFRAIKIETGIEMDDWIEIRNLPVDLKYSELVTSGAYYLFSELNNEE